MKTTNTENHIISAIVGKELGIRFQDREFSLGKWGDVDNYCEVASNRYVLMECENAQKHPNTNVLKLYPYLEENPGVSIILLHYFFPKNQAPKSRRMLCDYIANKIEQEFRGRFQYISLPTDVTLIEAALNQKNGLVQLLSTYEKTVRL